MHGKPIQLKNNNYNIYRYIYLILPVDIKNNKKIKDKNLTDDDKDDVICTTYSSLINQISINITIKM